MSELVLLLLWCVPVKWAALMWPPCGKPSGSVRRTGRNVESWGHVIWCGWMMQSKSEVSFLLGTCMCQFFNLNPPPIVRACVHVDSPGQPKFLEHSCECRERGANLHQSVHGLIAAKLEIQINATEVLYLSLIQKFRVQYQNGSSEYMEVLTRDIPNHQNYTNFELTTIPLAVSV